MKPTNKPLFQLTAADLMNPVVISIPREMSIKGAAHLLAQNRISGAPVVDDEGRCIGVVSSTDFVMLAGGDKILSNAAPQLCFCSDWAVLAGTADTGAADTDATVDSVMTGNPVMAHLAMSINDLARSMMDAHIHRVIIVDNHDHPVGIVTTTDLLAAFVHAEEQRSEPVRERREKLESLDNPEFAGMP